MIRRRTLLTNTRRSPIRRANAAGVGVACGPWYLVELDPETLQEKWVSSGHGDQIVSIAVSGSEVWIGGFPSACDPRVEVASGIRKGANLRAHSLNATKSWNWSSLEYNQAVAGAALSASTGLIATHGAAVYGSEDPDAVWTRRDSAGDIVASNTTATASMQRDESVEIDGTIYCMDTFSNVTNNLTTVDATTLASMGGPFPGDAPSLFTVGTRPNLLAAGSNLALVICKDVASPGGRVCLFRFDTGGNSLASNLLCYVPSTSNPLRYFTQAASDGTSGFFCAITMSGSTTTGQYTAAFDMGALGITWAVEHGYASEVVTCDDYVVTGGDGEGSTTTVLDKSDGTVVATSSRGYGTIASNGSRLYAARGDW